MGESEWCEHWKQVVWFLPRKVSMLVSSGEEVVVSASHDAISISYNVMNSEERNSKTYHRLPSIV
jgi:protein arginine N-methyltransferase 7